MSSISKRSIDLRSAYAAMGAALAKAKELGVTISVAITDPDGSIKTSARMDGSSPLIAELALNKAYTAASLGMASHEVHEFVKNDPPLHHGFSQYPPDHHFRRRLSDQGRRGDCRRDRRQRRALQSGHGVRDGRPGSGRQSLIRRRRQMIEIDVTVVTRD